MIMSNEEHVRILKDLPYASNVYSWNKWRVENPGTRPDLVGADLAGLRLKRMDFRGANFNDVDLSRANLSEVNLERATLVRANLQDADLRGANLWRVNLSDANLQNAILVGARISEAVLHGADVRGAIIGLTEFVSLDLSAVKGLREVKHEAPSSLGVNTVYYSGGSIPEEFLRGAGIPENFIEFTRGLMGRAFEYYSCFISYSTKDQEFADHLYTDLQAKGVRCFLATEDLKIGDKFRQQIEDAIGIHDRVLVVLSESSVNSNWVGSEVEAAFEKERGEEDRLVLFPIRLDDAVMKTHQSWAAEIKRRRHIGDFRNWRDSDSYKKSFERLLRDLQSRVKDAAVVTEQ